MTRIYIKDRDLDQLLVGYREQLWPGFWKRLYYVFHPQERWLHNQMWPKLFELYGQLQAEKQKRIEERGK